MTRMYRGRPLPRPNDELVDQGLSFDLGTLASRRRMLSILGIGTLGVGLAACGANTTPEGAPSTNATATPSGGASSLPEIPDETAGPYPGDGSNGPDVLEQSGVVRSDIRSSFAGLSGTADGVPITVELTVRDLAAGGTPFAGAAVYVWHCDRQGRYSLYSAGATEQNYLRGVQIADAAGLVRFTSIFPACYQGRWPHIHFEVYRDGADITDSTKAICTSQLALPEDVCDAVYATAGYESSVRTLSQVSLTSDNIFSDDGAGSQLATVTGDVRAGYRVALPVGVDTRTTPQSGRGGPGRRGPR